MDLGIAPLMRVRIVTRGPGVYDCIWTHHHIILDGWSVPLLMGELVEIYAALRQHRVPFRRPARPYSDYIAWLRKRDPQAPKEFWSAALLGFEEANDLRISRSFGSAVREGEYVRCRTQIDPALSQAVMHLCRAERITLSSLMQVCWGLLLSRYSGDEDVVFGATVSGRPAELQGSETMVGLFINTIPVRVQFSTGRTVRECLQQHQQWVSAASQFDHASLAEIHRWAGRKDGEALFSTLLVVENFPIRAAGSDGMADLMIEPGPSFTRTNYTITLAITPGASIGMEIGYDAAELREGIAVAIPEHLTSLLRQMTDAPEAPLASLALGEGGNADEGHPDHTGAHPSGMPRHDIVEQIRRCALRDPMRSAIVHRGGSVSYSTLDRRSNQLAQAIVKMGCTPGTVIGIVPDRSASTILVLLGILKAGGAYLPIDAALPSARVRMILEDAGASMCIVATDGTHDEIGLHVTAVHVDALLEHSRNESEVPPRPLADPRSAAYVIFTSGSTGIPKGVVVDRGAITHIAGELAHVLGMMPSDRVLHFLSLSFDAAGEEIWPTLMSGAALVIHPEPSHAGPDELIRFVTEQAVTVLHLPTAFWHLLTDRLAVSGAMLPGDLRVTVVGGESPSVEALARWSQKAKSGSRFVNVYGPTETTIAASHWEVEFGGAPADLPEPIPIGHPVGGVKIYVLDQVFHPVPGGVTGEIFIAGAGVSRGYAGNAGHTAAAFLPDPFSHVPGARMYRTGDTGYRKVDGAIVFMGRRDRQCKVRGFRIEPGEIEDCLRKFPGIRNAVVVVREDKTAERRLVAYVEAPELVGEPLDPIEMSLRQVLPDHLVPAAYVALGKLPLTPTGKIDRRALPAPGGEAAQRFVRGDPPRGATETIIAGIWEDLLQVHSVGRQDGFFALGGHSLLAIRLLCRLRDAFSIELGMEDVFGTGSLAELASLIDKRLRDPAMDTLPLLVRVDRTGVVPLSFAQQRLWFLDQLEPGSSVYAIPSLFRLTGRLDAQAFTQALGALVRRHEALRTSYHVVDGVPVQHIVPADEAVLDLSFGSCDGTTPSDVAAQEMIAADIRAPFRLNEGPLFRVRMYALGEEDHLLLIVIHHSIADGWSIGVLVREMCEAYGAFAAGGVWGPDPLAYQYADFAVWQRHNLTDERIHVLLDHWLRRLQGFPTVSTLPPDRPRPAAPSFPGAVEHLSADAALTDDVIRLARRENATVFMTLLAAFHCVLYRYSGQRDLVVGTPISGRTHLAFDRVIGFFVNTLALRAVIDPARSFADLLRSVRDEAVAAYAHQDIPFDRLVEALHPVRDLAHAPVFQTVFTLQDLPLPGSSPAGLHVTGLDVPVTSSTFDLSCEVAGSPDGYRVTCTYNSELYERTTITRFLRHYVRLLRSLVQNPDVPLNAVQMLTPEERKEQVVTWNGTRRPFAEGQTVHGSFSERAERHPAAIAVAYRGDPTGIDGASVTLTYGELDRRSDLIASRLQHAGVRPGDLVGICMDRSTELVAAVLACLKAGGGFVPLDPSYPQERLRFMVEEARPRLILLQTAFQDSGFAASVPVLDPAGLTGNAVPGPVDGRSIRVHAGDIAYVIFTSGSTGKPKGTLLAHRGLVNLAAAQASSFRITSDDRILQFSSLSFDASVWEIVMALLNGASLWLTDKATISDPIALAELIRREEITTVTLPPSILAAFPSDPLPSLSTIIVAGERCPAELAQRWGERRRFVNAYGPTETTVCASLHICEGLYRGSPPIGRPLQNVRTYIVDPDLHPLPAGVPGELLIGGVGLAYGYLHRAGATAERFIPDPFGGRGERLYRTGDRCRFLADGNIEFLGRLDHQVKIRGFRVEPGEIESALGEMHGVREAVVIPRNESGTGLRLVAYVVMDEGMPLDGAALRMAVRQRLPEFMVPSAFVRLDVMPLTPSGKVDRAALPVPSAHGELAGAIFVAPRTDTEKELSVMIQELLHCARAGAMDNFFDLGGHSLLATQLVSRINGRWRTTVPLRAVFENPTVAGIAEAIDAACTTAVESAVKISPVSRERAKISRTQLAPDRAP
jgi:amino acid adenylation domain-containing protein